MRGALTPEKVLKQLETASVSPVYLFYGEGEFRLEKVLGRIRGTFVPDETKDFNFQIFYGDQSEAADILDSARSFPFLSETKLVIVRRTEKLTPAALESFIPYLEDPMPSTCLIFISSKPDFRKKFYKKIKEVGGAVNFRKLYDNEVVPWTKRMAESLGMKIDTEACACLQQIVGNQMRDLYSELEKLHLRHGQGPVGIEEVQQLAIHSRIYSIFELMDEISAKRSSKAMTALRKFLEEEGRDAGPKFMGMLNRQIRLLWQTKRINEGGGGASDVARKLSLRDFQVRPLVQQSRRWKEEELERAMHLLYETDGRLKSGSSQRLVLEELVLSLCS